MSDNAEEIKNAEASAENKNDTQEQPIVPETEEVRESSLNF